MAIFCLFSISVFAQEKTDFSGNWIIDKKKSKFPRQMPFDSMNLKVIQNETELIVGDLVKDSKTANLNNSRPVIYKLDGSEALSELNSPMGKLIAKRKAEFDSNKLKATTFHTANTPNGEVNMTTTEIWELFDEGKSLKILRISLVRGVETTTEMFFNKN